MRAGFDIHVLAHRLFVALRPVEDATMTDEEIEVVAEALAQAGGYSWYPGRAEGPFMREVSDPYRNRARLVIDVLERYRSAGSVPSGSGTPRVVARKVMLDSPNGTGLRPGETVVYRPPGDRRAYTCRIVEICGSQAYLEPILRACTGWVSVESLTPLSSSKGSNDR
jgi:hypothetical protein